ncbi:Alpha-L-fucosidase 2 [Dendrobium catenatum]|uniref:Alpha-L-fucosidase 2 n=1 Tax=Dendrobium catenatum TaxID=906689 RepID=A0A2I0V7S7_9ASPA|nr:Alpha-L-fucosidase 2 [Dendrobium catenatum]
MEPEEEGEWVWVRPPTEADSEFWGNGDNEDDEPSRPLKLVFTEPAKHWTDAAPIGNGRLGAMVWGNVPNETLQLNHDTLWTGVPGDYTNPDAPSVLSKVRKLVDDGQYAEATAAAFGLSDHPPEAYQPLGNINLEFDDSHLTYTSYVRELDLSTATVKIKYNLGDVEFTREHFSSNPHQVVVTKLSSTKTASISFIVYLDSKLHHHSVANSANRIIMEGNCPPKRRPPKVELSKNSDGIQFAAVLDVQIAGNNAVVQVVEDRKLKIDGADWAVLLLAASSSFEGPFINPADSKRDPTSESLNTANSIQNLSFSQLLAYHLDDYLNLFHRVELQLSNGSDSIKKMNLIHIKHNTACDDNLYARRKLKSLKHDCLNGNVLVSTAERVNSFKLDEDPSLVELLFHYGRYLLISSSRPGTQVSNLQGIWNKDLEPPWEYVLNIHYYLQHRNVNYEASGWVAHQVSDVWAKTSPDEGDPVWAVWPMGGAWLCTHLWNHYTFSLDKAKDFEDPEVHHRHVSHLFGLFPGHTITVEKTPDLCKAAANTLYKRGDIGPGWSTTWKMALWSHLRDSSHTYLLIKQLINLVDPDHEADYEGGLYSNLFTAHPPFQIDANFGFSAAIAEMLVQSTMEDLYLLPALPRDKWPRGFVRGLKARGGVTVNISWKEGQLHGARLWSKTQSSLKRLHYNGKVAAISLSCGKIYIFNQHLKCLKITSMIEGVSL